jgi:short-subunit dehydrogenase
MDVADTDACSDLFKKVNFEFGRIDILINNAGYHKRGPFETVDVADLANMIDVNLKAPIVLMRIALPYMREAGGGAIINVGSLAGRTPVPNSATYAASKAALRSLTFSLAEEFAGGNIRVAVVSPGPIDTGFIMANIDNTSDLTFSQPISTAGQVAQTILDLCGNNQREVVMPWISGVLTTATYLMPWLARLMRPMLERRGANVKARLKRRR